jgi:hypothetical protein
MHTPTVASKPTTGGRDAHLWNPHRSPWCGAVALIIFFDTRV